jgi:hypothetical protein
MQYIFQMHKVTGQQVGSFVTQSSGFHFAVMVIKIRITPGWQLPPAAVAAAVIADNA